MYATNPLNIFLEKSIYSKNVRISREKPFILSVLVILCVCDIKNK